MEWSEFARRFALELAALDRDNILIVREREESRHYVQAMREPDRLYAESVSNNFLEGPLLLTPADEEILNEAGWRPPTATWSPANWWTELSPEADHTDYMLLADMMVTALRDVQGVRRPASLVYESFHRHGTGLIELTGFGIEAADRQRITESRPAPVPVPLPAPARPADDFEAQLSEAKQRGEHIRYFNLLITADLVLPATGPAVEDPGLNEYATILRDGSTHVLVFTSPQAMSQALGAHAGLHRRSTFVALAGSWPNPSWSLTVNTGLPSEISLDAAMIARLNTMHRASPETTMVDFVLPVVPSLPTPGLPDPTPELQYGLPEATYTPAEPPLSSNGTPLGTRFPPNEHPLAPHSNQPATPPTHGNPYARNEPPRTPNGSQPLALGAPRIPAEAPPTTNGAPYARNEPPHTPNGSQPPALGAPRIPAEAPPTTNSAPYARNEPPHASHGSQPPVVINGTPLGPEEAPPTTNGTPYAQNEAPRDPGNDQSPVTIHGTPLNPLGGPPTTNGTPVMPHEPQHAPHGNQPPVVVNGTALTPTAAPITTDDTTYARYEPPVVVNETPRAPREAPTTNGTPYAPTNSRPSPPETPVAINGTQLGPVEAPPATNGAPLRPVEALFSADGALLPPVERSPVSGGAELVAGEPTVPVNRARFAPVDKPVAAARARFDAVSELVERQAVPAGPGSAETTVQVEVPLASTAPALVGQVIKAPHGTRLFALHDTGVEALLAVYDGASGRWAGNAKVAADGYGRD